MNDPDLIPAGIVRCAPDARIEAVNATMLRWAGRESVSELTGRPFYSLLSPAGRIYFETHIRPMLQVEGHVQEIALELQTPGGERRRIYLNGQAERDEGGAITALHLACFSGGHRQSYERELLRQRRDAEGYVALVKSSADAIINTDVDHRIVGWNAAAQALFGYAEAEVAGRDWREVLLDGADARGSDENAVRSDGDAVRAEAEARHANGSRVAVEYHSSPIMDGSGDRLGMVTVVRDIRERRAAEETIRALNQEVVHRSKNQFAVIQAIARSTARHSSPYDFVEIFSNRLNALARNMSLLEMQASSALELRALADAQLDHLDEGLRARVSVDGPSVSLDEHTALYLGLALFELSTNALKYGALSQNARESGGVAVSWTMDGGELALDWVETGVRGVSAPSRAGFGSRLTGVLLERSTSGAVSADYRPGGLVWRYERKMKGES